ncbi:MAG: DNA topoisomerase, partial [Clostridia bacterium]|nr:DNA topoisomerase [Clostridia bacterium]
MAKNNSYGNESISMLKGPDRVRKRPSVIFGSDNVEGCQHGFFEILSNSVDEAREGYGNLINVTRYLDGSYEIEDFGRGVPLDYNEREKRYNWDLIYCELYAGGKMQNVDGGDYSVSLGLNGLGACATQCSSEFMDVTSYRDGNKYFVHFEKGVNKTKGKLIVEPYTGKRTGTVHRFKPDIAVFTDINIPVEFFHDILKRQAVANAGVRFVFKNETAAGKYESTEYFYEHGITDYAKEIVGDQAFTQPYTIHGERVGRDREDLKDYKVFVDAVFCFSNTKPFIEYYHNSSWLEHGGAPDKAARSAFVSAITAYMKQSPKYQKTDIKITFNDIADSLVLITNGFSAVASYQNQTKKAVTNKFIQDMMTDFLRSSLEVYFIENKQEADKIAEQILINKRSREQAEKTRLNVKSKLTGSIDISNRVEKFVDCRTKDLSLRELYIVEGDSALGSCKQGRDPNFQAIMPIRGKILNCLKADYSKIFASPIITDLIKVLGCGADVKVKTKSKDVPTFSLDNLRWNKVII